MRLPTPLLLPVAFALAACSSKDSSPSGNGTGGTLVVASVGDPVQLFPPLVSENNGKAVQDMVYDKLAEIGPALNTVGDKGFTPRLAKSWTWAPDSMSIAFAIDPRARWHDGKPVTAGDVKYAFKLFTDPKLGSPTGPLLGNIDSASVRDSATVVFYFRKRTPEQFFDVAYQLIPLPEHVYGSIPPDQMLTSEATRNIVGSGQFKVVKWEPKVRVELLADTANYRGRPKLDRVILTPVADPTAGMTQVLTEQADFLQAYPVDQMARLDSSKVARPVVYPIHGYTFLGFNPNAPKAKTAPHPIFADIRVRRALAMGIDRVGMLHNVFGDKGRLCHGPFSMTLPMADSTIKPPPYDTAAAKALLDSAGWRVGADGIRAKAGKPFRFRLLTPTTSLTRKQYAVLIQEQFRKLGVQADIEQLDAQTFEVQTKGGNYDAVLQSFNPDPGASGTVQNWGKAGIGPTGQNFLRYTNPTTEAYLDSAQSSFDPTKARAFSKRAFQQIVDDVPAIFLYDVVLIDAIHKRVNPGLMRPDGWAVDMGNWSIAPDKRIARDKIGLGAAKP